MKPIQLMCNVPRLKALLVGAAISAAMTASTSACRKQEPVAPTAGSPEDATTLNDAATAPAIDAGAASNRAFVQVVTSVRREPTDAVKVAATSQEGKLAKEAKKEVTNWLATVQRGESVTVLASRDAWSQVRLSDGQVGWAKSAHLLPVTPEVRAATSLEELRTFTRPDLLALNPSRKITLGALLFVTRSQDQFSLVSPEGQAPTWVLTEKLLSDSDEVEVARQLGRLRAMQARGEKGADDLSDLMWRQFPESELLALLRAKAAGATGTDNAATTAPAELAPAAGAAGPAATPRSASELDKATPPAQPPQE